MPSKLLGPRVYNEASIKDQKERSMHTRDEIKRLTELASCAG